MVLIDDNKIQELLCHRFTLGNANFFKLFRQFYRLANITENAENNPFGIYIDSASAQRTFKDVFGVDNKVLAKRFVSLFHTDNECDDNTRIDLLRWYFIMDKLL